MSLDPFCYLKLDTESCLKMDANKSWDTALSVLSISHQMELIGNGIDWQNRLTPLPASVEQIYSPILPHSHLFSPTIAHDPDTTASLPKDTYHNHVYKIAQPDGAHYQLGKHRRSTFSGNHSKSDTRVFFSDVEKMLIAGLSEKPLYYSFN